MPIDEIVGDAIDRAVTIEMRFAGGLPRGVTTPLYDAARRHHGKPLTWLAARSLMERVSPGRHVFVVTGAGAPPGLPKGETDGPIGAAAIARAVEIGLGAKPILLAEARNMPAVIASTEGSGTAVVDEDIFGRRKSCALAIAFPLGAAAGERASRELIDKFQPAAIVFVEKAGPNRNGVFHSIMGTPRSPDTMANAHFLALAAQAGKTLTIGIADGGNEIGCGLIADAVREVQPHGKSCGCPCGGGIGTVTPCDVLVFAAVSNWGAYGVAAALAGLTGNREVLHDPATELRMVQKCVDAGAMDGAYSRLIPYVDGTSDAVQAGLITILHQIVENGLKTYDRGF
jgi:hypothetical protein